MRKRIYWPGSFLCIALIATMAFGTAGCAGKEEMENTGLQTETAAETETAGSQTETAADAGKSTQAEGAKDVETPYGPKISKLSDAGIEYYWKQAEYADGYEVFRSYEEEGEYEKVAEYRNNTVSYSTHLDTTFDREKKSVWYKVRSYLEDEDGNRSYSEFTEPVEAQYREEMKLQRKTTYMPSGTTRTIEAWYGWGNGSDAVWTSDDEGVATISEEGVITAIAKGTCTLTCTSESLQTSLTSKVVVDRDAEEPLTEITSRYTQSEETGIWENPDAEETQDAVIMMVGDMMCTSKQIKAGMDEDGNYYFNDGFDYVSDLISQSDFAIGNLETMLSSSWPYMSNESYIDNMPNCNAPSSYLDAVKSAGFDAVVMANNHNCDTGERGILETVEQVERYQLGHTGLYTGEDDCRYLLVDVNGIQVGYLAYMSESTGYNGKDADWSRESIDTMLNYFTQEKAEQDIQALREAGAEYVIVYMHWGVKNNRTVNEIQKEEALQAAEAGADYIVGANPHLLQEYDELATSDGRTVPCFYSLGDFQSSISQIAGNRDSVILRIRLSRNEDGTIALTENTYIPCYNYTNYQDHNYPVIPLNPDLNGGIEPKKMGKFRTRIAEAVGNKIEEYTGG
ncbi:MAG: CapA family protein [Lachnospiraceae bacterium]|nr:CapA family protein [Lachnospiraceae bacterium]